MTYEANGNIKTKPDVGTYNYTGGKPNAVSQITSPASAYDPFHETITYTDFQKVESITDQENNNRLEFTYGPDYARRMMKTLEGGSLKKTKYYSNGLYEKIVNDLGQTKEINYISGSSGLAAVFIKDFDNTQKIYYVHQDYLGSILALTNENGTVAERYYFDAWGNRKNPNNWSQNDSRTSSILDRGFTGHEHLDHFNLINMSRPKGEHEQELRVTFGRVYDASLGSFLSADPVIQAPNYTQDLNLYSYAYGNPLKYTDPSGYFEMSRPDTGYERTRGSGGSSYWFFNSTHIVHEAGGGFEDYNTLVDGTWFNNNDLKRDGYQTFSGPNALNDAMTAIQPRPEYGNPLVTVGDLICNGVTYSEESPSSINASSGGYEKMSDWVNALWRMKHNLTPDAISISGNIDLVLGGGFDYTPVGKLYVLNGEHAGKETRIGDAAAAYGYDVGLSAVLTSYYYVGNINNMRIDHFRGHHMSISMGASYFVEVGGGYTIAPLANGDYIIGKMIHLGVSPPGYSGNISWGITDFEK